MLTLIINLQKGKLADRLKLTIISLAIDVALFIALLK